MESDTRAHLDDCLTSDDPRPMTVAQLVSALRDAADTDGHAEVAMLFSADAFVPGTEGDRAIRALARVRAILDGQADRTIAAHA